MKRLFIILLLLALVFSLSGEVLASFSKSVTETQIEGEGEVYQYVETTVNGETIRKESRKPGKVELEMEKTGENEPRVTFSQEESSPTPFLTPSPTLEPEKPPISLIVSIIGFFRRLFSGLTGWFK